MEKQKNKFFKKIMFLVVVLIGITVSSNFSSLSVEAATHTEAESEGYSWEINFNDGTGTHYMMNMPITDWKSSAPAHSTMGGMLGVVYTNQQAVRNLSTTDGAVVHLYAVWEANTYAVNFIGNGNTSGSMPSITLTSVLANRKLRP